MFADLFKAAVAVALTPVSLVLDVITLPASSMDLHRGPFDRTAKTIDQATAAVDAALTPEKL